MPDFLTTLQTFESGDRRHPERGGTNIANTRQGTSSGQAQGYNQITTGTWKEFGGLAYAPTPLQATREQQNAIAAKIPLKRWAPETLAYLRNNGFTLNPNATLADNIAVNHGTLGVAPAPHSTTPQAPGPVDTSIIARGGTSPPIPTTPGTTINSTPVVAGGGIGGQTEQLANNLKKTLGMPEDDGKDQGQQDSRPSPIVPAPPARNVSPLIGNPQLYAQRMAALSQPMQWGAAPLGQMFGAGYGPQQPVYGTSLMSNLQMLNDPTWMNQNG